VNLPAIRTAYANAHAPKFLVEIADAGHYAFSNGCFPSPDCAPPATLTQDEAHERVLRYPLPFLAVYLPAPDPSPPSPPPPARPGRRGIHGPAPSPRTCRDRRRLFRLRPGRAGTMIAGACRDPRPEGSPPPPPARCSSASS